jgi:hypothetical protein
MTKSITKHELNQEDFNSLHQKAKGIDGGWVELIVKRVNPKLELEENERFKKYHPLHTKKIYNIFNNVVTNKSWRAFIYKEVSDWVTEQETGIADIKQEAKS